MISEQTVEIPIAAQAPPAPPAAPAIAGGAAGGGSPAVAPVACSDIGSLRQARSELSNQLTSVNDRREELISDLSGAAAVAVPGLQARLQVLDARLVQIEQDIQTTGQQLVNSQRACAVVPSRPAAGNAGFWNSDVAEFAGVAGTLVLAFAAVRIIWARTKSSPPPMRDPAADMRMERLEQAVDAIAIEVERVGESQRFQAKLLNEGAAQPIGVRERESERARG
jgi:chromosome segregation ATPase